MSSCVVELLLLVVVLSKCTVWIGEGQQLYPEGDRSLVSPVLQASLLPGLEYFPLAAAKCVPGALLGLSLE